MSSQCPVCYKECVLITYRCQHGVCPECFVRLNNASIAEFVDLLIYDSTSARVVRCPMCRDVVNYVPIEYDEVDCPMERVRAITQVYGATFYIIEYENGDLDSVDPLYVHGWTYNPRKDFPDYGYNIVDEEVSSVITELINKI